jgi:uncharacterized protein
MPRSVIDSLIFRDIFGSPAMREIWADEFRTQKYLDWQVRLARVSRPCGAAPWPSLKQITLASIIYWINVALSSKFWGRTIRPTSSEQLLAYTQEDLMITEDYVRKIFKGLEHGDGAGFFEHVDDKVDWIVEGTHPLAGHYKSKSDFLAGTFAKLGKVLPNGAQLIVEHLLVKDDQAVVELHSLATAKNGLRFDNRYCWVVHFDGDTIDRARAYLDSAMVARLFEENPI